MAEELSLQLLDQFITVASELNATNKPCLKPKQITAKNEDSQFLEKISKFDKGITDISDPIPISSIQSVLHTGETDSSDDEDLRDIEHRKYNESGRDIRRLLASSSSSTSPDLTLNPSWKAITTKKAKNSNNVSPKQIKSKLKSIETKVYSDPIFGLRLVNPLISSVTLQERMKGRKAVSMCRMKHHVATLNSNEDWVFAGAIISKVVKKSQKGNQFSIWTISDLHNDLKTVALFLFSVAHKNLWKTVQGTVVGVLNPTVMEQKEKSSDQATLSVNNSDRIMILGQSKDLGTCRSRKKSGDPCTAFVNKNRCEYCIYHVKAEYQKFSARSDLQSSFVGSGPNALRNKVLGKNEVFYAGKSFTAVKPPSKRSSQKLRIKDEGILAALSSDVRINTDCNVRAKNLNKGVANKIDSSVSQRKKDIELLQKLYAGPKSIEATSEGGKRISRIPPNEPLKTTKTTAQYDRTFDLFTGQLETKKNFDGTLSSSVTLSDSKSTALDVIAKLKEKKFANKELLGDTKNMAINLTNDDLNYDSDDLNSDKFKIVPESTEKTTSKLKQDEIVRESKNVVNIFETTTNISKKELAKSKLSSRTIPQLEQSIKVVPKTNNNSPKSNLAFDIPLLSGFSGRSVDLNAPISRTHMNRAKQNAIIYVQRNGPIAKVDPMDVKSAKRKTPVHSDIMSPCVKKLKEIEENEFMSQRFKRLMAASSRHSELLQKIDNEEQDKYFNKMEIKEKMEDKMLETFKVNCKAVQCLKCKYTSFSASDRCKAEKHPLRVFDTVKRFFKCSNCGNRTVSLTVVPLENCQKCSDGKWERCAMIAERNVKSLTQLSIRGGEEHFVGGAVTNANINLMICKKFNDIGGKYLSRGFIQMEKRHSVLYKRVRSMLPRRESERRVHHLARHCDILSAVETRCSMMNMTFMKYIESKACCFIPGKVLDEFYKILSLIETDASPPKTHELMQELRDISSMAMEHFDEHIVPGLKERIEKTESPAMFPFKSFFAGTGNNDTPPATIISAAAAVAAAQRSPKLFIASVNDQLRKFRRHTKLQRAQLSSMVQHMQKLTRRVRRQTIRLKAQHDQLMNQERLLREHGVKMQDQDAIVIETKRRVDEWELKFTQVSNELLETRENLQKLSQQQQKQVEQDHNTRQVTQLQQAEEEEKGICANQTSGVDILEPVFPTLYMRNIKPREARVDFKFLKRQQDNLLPIITQDRKRKKPVDYNYSQSSTEQLKKSRASIHCDYYIENLRDTLSMIIKENITNNISKSVIEDEEQYQQSESPSYKDRGTLTDRPNKNFTSFLSASLENLIRGPLSSITSRKRKMSVDIDFN